MRTREGCDHGYNVVPNGRNWNYIRLLTGLGRERRGHRLHSIQFNLKPNKVTIILKKDSPKGPQVAFLEAQDLDNALYNLAWHIKAKRLKWRHDKWRAMRSDKKQNP